MAYRSDYGWHPRAVCSREDLHQQRGSHNERRDDSQVPPIREEADDILPEEVSRASIEICRVQ